MSEYTPTLEQARARYAADSQEQPDPTRLAEFDRFLAAVRADQAAKTREETVTEVIDWSSGWIVGLDARGRYITAAFDWFRAAGQSPEPECTCSEFEKWHSVGVGAMQTWRFEHKPDCPQAGQSPEGPQVDRGLVQRLSDAAGQADLRREADLATLLRLAGGTLAEFENAAPTPQPEPLTNQERARIWDEGYGLGIEVGHRGDDYWETNPYRKNADDGS